LKFFKYNLTFLKKKEYYHFWIATTTIMQNKNRFYLPELGIRASEPQLIFDALLDLFKQDPESKTKLIINGSKDGIANTLIVNNSVRFLVFAMGTIVVDYPLQDKNPEVEKMRVVFKSPIL